jgi:thermitase
MLNLLYPVSYLLSLTGLILWFYFRENSSMSRRMSGLFLISFLIYLCSLAFTEASLSYKLLILFRDMAILAIVSQVFNYVRAHPIVVLLLALIVYGLIQFAGFNMLYSTFPETYKTATAADDQFELLVETKDGTMPKGYARLIERYGLVVEPAFSPSDYKASRLDEFLVIGIPDDAERKTREIIRELKRISGTEHVEYNEVIQVEIQADQPEAGTFQVKHVNDPMANRQWGWNAIQGDMVHDKLKASGIKPRKTAIVAILDTGVDAQHEDLNGQFKSSGTTNDKDVVGHGTHCAGIAAAISNNQVGVASLIPSQDFVKVTSIKVLNNSGMGTQQAIIQGMIKAADMGVDIISMSLGSISSDTRQKAYNEAVAYANAKGAIVIVAAGNSNQSAKDYAPANANGAIAVAAIGPDEQKASFSNSVSGIKYGIAAPGVNILSTYPGNQYKAMDGTSMATPMVAGLAALLKSFNPALTTRELYDILNDTGKQIPGGNNTGRLIQSEAALEKVVD